MNINSSKIHGMTLAAIGVFVVSFDALLVRLADIDPMVISFYRGLFMGISMLLVWRVSSTKTWRPKSTKELMMFIIIISLTGLSSTLFVFSVSHTTAANTVVLLATSSFFAAIFTYLITKERIQKSTAIAIIISFIGVLIIFGNSLSLSGNLKGDVLGLIMAITMGLELTLLRKYHHFPHILIISLGGFLVGFVIFFLSSVSFEVSLETLFWLMLMGLVQMPLAMYLIFISTKYITSTEVSLFTTIETTLAPLWLWIFLYEVPPKMTLIGGSLVLMAIFINALPKIFYKKSFNS